MGSFGDFKLTGLPLQWDFLDVEEAERGKTLDSDSTSHEVNRMVGKIKHLLKSMALAGASPSELRTEAENQLKRLEKSSDSLFMNRGAFQESSKELARYIHSLNKSSPDFSPFPLIREQPKTARQLMAEDPMWSHKRTNLEENMAVAKVVGGTIKVMDQVVHAAVENFCNDATGKQVCQMAGQIGSQVANYVDERTGIASIMEKAHAAHERSKNLTMPNLLDNLYALPKEQTRQWVDDSRVLTGAFVASALTGGAGKLLTKVPHLGTFVPEDWPVVMDLLTPEIE